jgi:AbrB family looped-hinge helix DNA binding protein
MPDRHRTRLISRGAVVIPAWLRRRLGLKPGDHIFIEAEENGLRLQSYAQVLNDVQAHFAPFAKPGVSIVDELIAERRAEAARANDELAGWRKRRQQNPTD